MGVGARNSVTRRGAGSRRRWRAVRSTGEDLLRLRATRRAIPATDLPIHDGWADRVFGAPVGRIDARVPQEGQERRMLDVEMGGKPPRGGHRRRRVNQPSEPGEGAAAGHGEAVVGKRARVTTGPQRQGIQQCLLDGGGPGAARVIGAQHPTPAQQMRETRLMQGLSELAIRCPSVADQHAVERGAEHGGGVRETATGPNGIHRGVGRRIRPEPVQHRADAPAGFIGTDHRAPSHLIAERGVRRGRHARGAMEHVHEPTRCNAQPKALAQHQGDLLERDAEVFVKGDDERDRVGAQVHRRGAERVGGLQRMSALHAPPTPDTPADVNGKLPDDRPNERQIFLILGGDPGGHHRLATTRARGGERRVVGLIHARRHRPASPATIGRTTAPPRPPTCALRAIFRKRGGLAEPRAPRRIQLLLDAFVSSFPAITVSLRTGQFLTQPRDLVLLSLDQIVTIVIGPLRAFVGHARVMPEGRTLYRVRNIGFAPLTRGDPLNKDGKT